MKDAKEMTVEELRAEVEKIRMERSGKGRVRRAESKSRRIQGQMGDRKRKEDAERVEEAEWV